MKTWNVIVTYPNQRAFEVTLRAESETAARRMAARLAAACGWDELPHKTISYETREAA